MKQLLALIKQNALLTLALVLLLGAAGAFGINALSHARAWKPEPPAAVAPWMTNRYIAHTWDLPKKVMDEDLGLPRTRGGPMSLKAIAEERGLDLDTLIADVEAAIAAHKAQSE